MRAILTHIRNVALALGVTLALGFGAAEVLSGTPTLQCNAPGPCQNDADCTPICIREGFPGPGACFVDQNCCLCVE